MFRLCVLRAFRWLAYDRFCLGVAIGCWLVFLWVGVM